MMLASTPQSLAAEIGLLQGPKKFLVVEGKTDRAFFWRQLRGRDIDIRPLNGKQNVLAFARLAAERSVGNALAVVDTNGWTVTGLPTDVRPLRGQTLAHTERRDLEMDLIESVGLEAVVAAFLDHATVERYEHAYGEQIEIALLRAAAVLGAVRLALDHAGITVPLEGIVNVVDFDQQTIALTVSDVLRAAESRGAATTTQLAHDAMSLLELYPVLLLARGHDLSSLVARLARGTRNGHRCTSTEVERVLCAAVSKDAFAATSLGRVIYKWADTAA